MVSVICCKPPNDAMRPVFVLETIPPNLPISLQKLETVTICRRSFEQEIVPIVWPQPA